MSFSDPRILSPQPAESSQSRHVSNNYPRRLPSLSPTPAIAISDTPQRCRTTGETSVGTLA